jgi:hypothetical protein
MRTKFESFRFPKQIVTALVGVGIAASAAPLVHAGSSKSVTVNNTAANPVPVTVQNQAAVTVTNTPSVNVANQPGVTVQNQVATAAADNPAFQPYIRSVEHNGVIDDNHFITFDVPAKKRLVIESITLEVVVPDGQKVKQFIFVTAPGGAQPRFFLPSPSNGPVFVGDIFYDSAYSLRLYSEAGNGSVTIAVVRNSNQDNWSVSASISGYLVDVAP